MALGVGGLCQLLAGMWEFAAGNTFGATAFSSYGGFWISFGIIFWPSSGVLTAYTDPTELNNAVGFYLIAWFIFTLLMFLGTFRTSAALSALFFFLTLTFMLLAIGDLLNKVPVTKAGGVLGIITAFIAYYCATSNLLTPEAGYFVLPAGALPKRQV